MSDKKKNEHQAGGDGRGRTPDNQDSAGPEMGQRDGEAAGSSIGSEAQVATLQAELDDLQSRLLRLSADYQNYARRSQQNIDDAKQQQLMSLARGLLAVLDHFDRALEVDPKNAGSQGLLQGVQIVRDELHKLLEQWGIRKIAVQPGDVFNPLFHEAVMRQPAPTAESGAASEPGEAAPNRVAAVFQAGYTLGDKTLRPAKVSIVG